MTDSTEFEVKRAADFSSSDTAVFIPGRAEGAIHNGRVVVKVDGEPDDSHALGARALVLSSMGPIAEMSNEYGYFVEWEDMPGIPVFVSGHKLREVV